MKVRGLALAGALSVAALIGSGAQAQTIISRTSDYTLSFNPNTFAGASEVYGQSLAYDAVAFTNQGITETYASDASNITFQQGGGVTIAEGTMIGNNLPITVTDPSGTLGFWGTTYDTAGDLTKGVSGGLDTLTFTGGGSISNVTSPIQYFIDLHVAGDWTEGTSTGDYKFNGVGSDFFAPPVVTFDSVNDVTTFATSAASYKTTNPPDATDFSITFYGGSATPEPATWALMLVGVGALGAALRMAARKNAMALTAA
jgi:hypothetical protein